MNKLIKATQLWAIDKGLDTADPAKQLLKVFNDTKDVSLGGMEIKSYEITIGIGDELMFLFVPKAVDEDDAIQQVYDSDQVQERDAENVDNLEIIEVVGGLE